MPLYKQATVDMLAEQDNVFSMFVAFLGAELKQKTAITPQKDDSGCKSIAPNYSQSLGLNQEKMRNLIYGKIRQVEPR